ncbi:unnamed protein product [Cuscuta europaea]|uniref:Uncharacterized protein n=1 Tax=Cuscuta europaea TaxID=41803 RepID=A0A9P0ZB87_CUSEU|nr:unnamed protein product [Cuscuta europaea]
MACGVKKTDQVKASKASEQNATSQNTFLVFKVRERIRRKTPVLGAVFVSSVRS